MRFSIIIPAYNAETFLKECLESVDRQDYSDYEIIIIEDGSTDSTPELVDLASKKNEKINVIHKSNQGLLLARHDGVLNSRGDYLIFLDADDMLNLKTLRVCSDIIDERDPDVIIYGMTNDPCYKKRTEKRVGSVNYYEKNKLDKLKILICQGGLHSMCGKAIRRSCFTDKIPYNKYAGLMHGEDLLQCIYIFDNISNAYITNEKLYYYRPNSGASTSEYKRSQLSDLKKVLYELDTISTKWGEAFLRAAFVGKALQICYLLRLLVNSKLSLQKKQHELLEFSKTLKDFGYTTQAIKKAKMRVDYKIELCACLDCDLDRLKRTITLTDQIKKILGYYR